MIENNFQLKKLGPFIVGPKVGNPPPVKKIEQCLGRLEGTDDFYTLKILSLKQCKTKQESIEEVQGKILLHNEDSLLQRMKGWPGIIQRHAFVKEYEMVENRRVIKHIILAIDPIATPHDFSSLSNDGSIQRKHGFKSQLINLQHYFTKKKRILETEALEIFYNIVQIISRLHQAHIVHRDVKLGNFVLNIDTKEVMLGNFCLGKELDGDEQLLTDQRGSPAYVAPEVINGNHYKGKPADMWSLGITFYTMLFGTFPFHENEPKELFRKIKAAKFTFPLDVPIGIKSATIIRLLLQLDPEKRPSAQSLLKELSIYMSIKNRFEIYKNSQKDGNDQHEVNNVHNPFELENLLLGASKEFVKQSFKNDTKNENDSDDGEDSVNSEDNEKVPTFPLPHEVGNILGGLRLIPIFRIQEDARVLSIDDRRKLEEIYRVSKAKGVYDHLLPASERSSDIEMTSATSNKSRLDNVSDRSSARNSSNQQRLLKRQMLKSYATIAQKRIRLLERKNSPLIDEIKRLNLVSESILELHGIT